MSNKMYMVTKLVYGLNPNLLDKVVVAQEMIYLSSVLVQNMNDDSIRHLENICLFLCLKNIEPIFPYIHRIHFFLANTYILER